MIDGQVQCHGVVHLTIFVSKLSPNEPTYVLPTTMAPPITPLCSALFGFPLEDARSIMVGCTFARASGRKDYKKAISVAN